MSGHLSDEQLRLYRSRSLPPDVLVSISDHLFSCDACFHLSGSYQPRANESEQGLERDGDLKSEQLEGERDQDFYSHRIELDHDFYYEQMERYVDGEMAAPDRSKYELHLQNCRICMPEVADLLDLKASMLAANQLVAGVGDGESQPVRLQGSQVEHAVLPPPALSWYVRPVPVWAGAAAGLSLAVLLSLVIVLPMRRELSRLREQIGAVEQRSELNEEHAKAEIEELSGRLKDVETADRTRGPGRDGADIASEAPVTLKDGEQVIELRDGSLKGLESATSSNQKAVELALATGKLDIPRLESLLGRPSTLMGQETGTASLTLTAPVGIVVEEDRPLFTWTAAPGAVSYRVLVTFVRSQRVLRSGPLTATQWRATKALPRGGVYSWVVEATFGDGRETSAPAPPAPFAKFKVLEASQEERLREARRLNPQSHLLLGVLYAKAGLIGSARREMETLSSENPGSEVMKKLQLSLEHTRSRWKTVPNETH